VPLVLALVNESEVVAAGLRSLLADQGLGVRVVRVPHPDQLTRPVDLALFDPHAPSPPTGDPRVLAALVRNEEVAHVVAFAPALDPVTCAAVVNAGAHGAVSSRLSAARIAEALARIAEGEVVLALPDEATGRTSDDWPGRAHGVTAREGEILLLAAQGMSNPEIARALFLSPETVKSYMSSVFTKMGFRNRVEATAYVLRSSGRAWEGTAPRARPSAPAEEADGTPSPTE
jgi:DNA-binding NarL/FixJ family response regulator